jgi:hypothetical protein
LQSALAEQKQMLATVVRGNVDTRTFATDPEAHNYVPARSEEAAIASEAGTGNTVARGALPVSSQFAANMTGQEPFTPQQTHIEEELQRGREIADVAPTTPALQLGPAKIRVILNAAFFCAYRPL